MMPAGSLLRRFAGDDRGAVAIETAIVAPVLVLMSLGSFEVSQIVARQSELQGAMSEASAIALAAEPTSETRRTALKSIIQTSTGLSSDHVVVDEAYRCGAATQMQTTATGCDGEKISSYIKVVLTDSYQPVWSKYGVGSAYSYNITRYVLIKQQVD